MVRTPGLLEPPGNLPALEAERSRLERELAATGAPRARRLLALELRRVVIAAALAGDELQATREKGS